MKETTQFEYTEFILTKIKKNQLPEVDYELILKFNGKKIQKI